MKFPRLRLRLRWRPVLIALAVLVTSGVAWAGVWWHHRYAVADEMEIPIREFTAAEYPEDPGEHSLHACQYSGRRLRLIRRDRAHFDFVFEPLHDHIATIVFRNIDVSLMTPSEPEWTKSDADL